MHSYSDHIFRNNYLDWWLIKNCFLICELTYGQRIKLHFSSFKHLYRNEYFIKYISVNKICIIYNSYAIHVGILSYYYLKTSTCPELFMLIFFNSISVGFSRETLQSQWPLPLLIHPNYLSN